MTGPGGEAAAMLARGYDLDLRDDPGDLQLYEALARRTGGPILELAVGSGRLAVPLALAGWAVTGVDNDGAMLDRARAAWQRQKPRAPPGGDLRLIEADLLDLRLDEDFALVILALDSLLLLGERDPQVAALRTMTEHLAPGGLAVVDVGLPSADELALYDGRMQLEWERDDPETGERMAKMASARHDPATAAVILTQWFEAWPLPLGPPRRVSRADRLRLVGAAELTCMAEAAGLVVEQLAGDHGMGPFGPGADRVVLLGTLV